MEMQFVLIAIHGLLTLLVVVSFLCGQWPIFQGTVIQRIHIFFTIGAYDYFLRFVEFACGQRGSAAIISVERYFCDRPNPILQILYLIIVGSTYYSVAESSFDEIPNYYLSESHIYISIFAVCVGVALFLLTSFSDPGTVTSDNVSAYITAYPYDNILFSEKECSTCKFPKPARSKHCSICGRCVARFDHHCGWMNNCIGENNNRYFLAFLLWHFVLCLYGSVALCLLLVGRIKDYKIVEILTTYYGVDNNFRSLLPHVVQWLLGSYNMQMLLIVFLTIVSMLLLGFFGYHVNLCVKNITTNESFKWQEYKSLQKKVAKARASAAALKSGRGGVSETLEKSNVENVNTNAYDHGAFQNLLEVLFPPHGRLSFLSNKPKSS